MGLFLLAGILFGVFHLDKILSPSWNFIIGITLYDVANLAQTALYVFGFLLLFVNKTWWRRQMLKLAPFGRMALTNYVLQTLVGTFIFFGYGFGLLGDIGSTVAAALSIALFILQRIGSRWWLERYYFGPLEWLWRSLTFWKIQPFKK